MAMNLRDVFNAAIEAVGGESALRRHLGAMEFNAPVYLLAVGKAASDMTRGALPAIGEHLVAGLVLTKYDHLSDDLLRDARLSCHESAHPVPDQASLAAGDKMIDFVAGVPADATLVVLISGGASALVEKLPAQMTLDDLGHVSAGRVIQLVISDVPGDRLQDVGSGPLAAAAETGVSMPDLPDWIVQLQAQVPGMPAPGDPVFDLIESEVVASSRHALEAAEKFARDNGATVHPVSGDLHHDVHDNVAQIAAVLRNDSSPPGLYIWAGESTLELPANPGRGGRNQHLAALLAKEIRGLDIRALCCATDGTDGPTADAGGYVDGQTMARMQAAGIDLDDYLARADCGNALEKAGALFTTGPTGTNVMDLVIAEKAGST